VIKRVSLVRRKAGMSREAFLAHWMGPHAEIVRQLPGLMGLRFGVVERWYPEGSGWDGVGELWFEDIAAAEFAFKSEPHISRLIEDRKKFLGAAEWCFVQEVTAIAPPTGKKS
jgi:uncharacterized protein (TIGR02118 family)